MEKTMKFLKTPLNGDKIKVYLTNKTFVYGIVKAVITEAYEKFIPNGNSIHFQEMVIVEQNEEIYNINEVSFFFDAKRVKFIN